MLNLDNLLNGHLGAAWNSADHWQAQGSWQREPVSWCPHGKNNAVKEWANGGRKYHPKVPFSGKNLTKCKWKKKNEEMLLHGARTRKEVP